MSFNDVLQCHLFLFCPVKCVCWGGGGGRKWLLNPESEERVSEYLLFNCHYDPE